MSGIVCKVWNIQGKTETKNAKEQLGDSIGYILNSEKTDYKSSEPLPIDNIEAQLGRECQYISNDIKTVEGAYVGTRNLVSDRVNDAVREMLQVKEFYEKLDGRAALHGIISLEEEESDIKNAPELMELCREMLEEVFPNHQAIFAVHTNTENLHVHFVINSVGLDGKKIHQDDHFMSKILHPCINKLAKKHGFTSNDSWNNKKSNTFTDYVEIKIILRVAIDEAIEQATDFDSFLSYLRKNDYITNVGKYISIRTKDMSKPIRVQSLGPNYTKEAIIERIATRLDAFETIEASEITLPRKKATVFTPEYKSIKRYKDMDDDEKIIAISELKAGRNPWKAHYETSWQMQDIARKMNFQAEVKEIVDFFSDNGSISDAMEQIITYKKKIAEDKRQVRAIIKKHKPELDIYNEMKRIEKEAYLYEYANESEYRDSYERYRSLTKRLAEGYGKSLIDVAAFIEECNNQLLLMQAQLHELSNEYKILKKYANEHGYEVGKKKSLTDIIGVYDRTQMLSADAYYIVSEGSDVFMRVVMAPVVDESGRVKEEYKIAVFTPDGDIICEKSGLLGTKELVESVAQLQEEYEFEHCNCYKKVTLAREYAYANEQVSSNDIKK